MVLTLKEAERNLIKAQKEAQRAYKNVEKTHEIYYKLMNNGKKKSVTKKSSTKKKSITKKKNVTKKNSTKKKSVTKKNSIKKNSTKKSHSTKCMNGGGGSDWLNTVNSRGNVAGPNDHWGASGSKWFNQFEKSGDYISMSNLRRGSYELQKAATETAKIPTGFDPNSEKNLVFSFGNDLGTQRI